MVKINDYKKGVQQPVKDHREKHPPERLVYSGGRLVYSGGVLAYPSSQRRTKPLLLR